MPVRGGARFRECPKQFPVCNVVYGVQAAPLKRQSAPLLRRVCLPKTSSPDIKSLHRVVLFGHVSHESCLFADSGRHRRSLGYSAGSCFAAVHVRFIPMESAQARRYMSIYLREEGKVAASLVSMA